MRHIHAVNTYQRFRWRISIAAAYLLLAACGGGDNDTPSSPQIAIAANEHKSFEGGAANSHGLPEGTKQALAAQPNAAPSAITQAVTQAVTQTWLTVQAAGSLAGNVGPVMVIRKDGATIGSVEVRSTVATNYAFLVPNLIAGSNIDVVFTNDDTVNGQDRNLTIFSLQGGGVVQLPTGPRTLYDRGSGAQAFDNLDTVPAGAVMPWSGALRILWPADPGTGFTAAQASAARLLRQATFGPTLPSIQQAAQLGAGAWIAEQMALPYAPDFVNHLNNKFSQGTAYRPGGDKYDNHWVTQHFWATAAASPDQLRKRVAWALHQMLVVSQVDSNLHEHSRAYAQYLDILNKHAFGNYRQLLEEVALSPVMGIYLSHIRNQKEDPATNRQPDENFARELMQLFTIGLHELNSDGTARLGNDRKPIETYGNEDVAALAKVFTGYSWSLPNNQLTENDFRWGGPDYRATVDSRLDLNPMRTYAVQHSTASKTLFAGRPYVVNIPANTYATFGLRWALDGLFNHPNMAPFVSRQLIQRLVTSAPSAAYVARVAAAFNNNGRGVRGDMAATIRAVLLDTEARNNSNTDPGFGRLMEPVLRMTNWMRAMEATSASGRYTVVFELDGAGQRALYAPSVFGYYRPGYVPPQTSFASRGATAPEFQIVNESTVASWVNKAQEMSGSGVGWNGTGVDVSSSYASLAALAAQGNVRGMVQHLNLLLFAGTMSTSLQQHLVDGIVGVNGADSGSHNNRARVAVLLALASPEYLVQR